MGLPLIMDVPMSSELVGASELALQLIIDCSMKLLISEVTSALPSTATHPVAVLTERERNCIRYMAGYVVMKVLHNVTKTCTDEKHRAFVKILQCMKATDQVDVLAQEDSTRAWVEQVNRGGLCLVRKEVIGNRSHASMLATYTVSYPLQVQLLMEEIEMVTRKYLDTRTKPSGDISAAIVQDALQNARVLNKWSSVADFDDLEWRAELLQDICKLWITIRSHAFAQGWTDKFGKVSKKGTRKTLKNKGTDKENK